MEIRESLTLQVNRILADQSKTKRYSEYRVVCGDIVFKPLITTQRNGLFCITTRVHKTGKDFSAASLNYALELILQDPYYEKVPVLSLQGRGEDKFKEAMTKLIDQMFIMVNVSMSEMFI
jgi:hypothetical protein